MEQANAALMLALRMAISLPFFLGVGFYAVLKLRRDGKPLPSMAMFTRATLVGFVGYYVSSQLDFAGLIYISAQLERLVLFTYPIFVMILGWMFFKARITKFSTHKNQNQTCISYGRCENAEFCDAGLKKHPAQNHDEDGIRKKHQALELG